MLEEEKEEAVENPNNENWVSSTGRVAMSHERKRKAHEQAGTEQTYSMAQ